MVPAAFFAGMTLPLLTFILYARGRGEADIGAVYGWNTLGAIAGTALGGLVLMPLIGLKNLLVAGAALDIALGLALIAALLRRRELSTPRTAAALAAISVIAVIAAIAAFDLDVTRMASGVFRSGRPQISEDWRVDFHADGRTATVDVIVNPRGATSIATNGKVDASINMVRARGDHAAPAGPDEYTMTLLAALPLAHAPGARRVAVIGHGSGLTTHVVLASPRVEQVDVIEIEPEMVRGARAFLPRVERAYEDRRARLFVEDARAFFARASQGYDIIISEPSNPWVSGVASLFTPEFYRQAKRALNPNGLFVQWFQTYEIDGPLVASIVRGIGAVFSDYVLYAANDLRRDAGSDGFGRLAITFRYAVRMARDASRARVHRHPDPGGRDGVPDRESPRLRAAARKGALELGLLPGTRVRRRAHAFPQCAVLGAHADRA